MTAYIDSSVILRILLGQRGALREWKQIRRGVASALVEVECLKTLDRLRIVEAVPEGEIAVRRQTVYRIVEALEIVEPSRVVLNRAAQPLPITLGTLDAIHLATALSWHEQSGESLVMATHDRSLVAAARSVGMTAIGS